MAEDQEDDPAEGPVGSNGAPSYPMMTNQPGVEVRDPVRRFRVLAIIWAAAIVLASGAAAHVATTRSNANTDRHVDQVLAEIDKRTKERKRNERVAAAILEQNRRTLCELLAEHRDRPDIVRLHQVYRCGTAHDPIVPPGWTPPPGWPLLPGAAMPATPTPTPTPTD